MVGDEIFLLVSIDYYIIICLEEHRDQMDEFSCFLMSEEME